MKNWSEMTTRERDALVAERVMGWYLTGQLAFGEHPQGYPPNPWSSFPWGVPHYTTNIGAAWEVVNKFRATHFFELCTLPTSCMVEIEHIHERCKPESDRVKFVAVEDTEPEAICVAALKAMGVDVQVVEEEKVCVYCQAHDVYSRGSDGKWICVDCLSECEPIARGDE